MTRRFPSLARLTPEKAVGILIATLALVLLLSALFELRTFPVLVSGFAVALVGILAIWILGKAEPGPKTKPGGGEKPGGEEKPDADTKPHGPLVRAEVTARKLLDLHGFNPYTAALKRVAPGEERYSCFLWLPHSENLNQARAGKYLLSVAICTVDPAGIAGAFRQELEPEMLELFLNKGPSQLFEDSKRRFLESAARALADGFTVVAAVPFAELGEGRIEPSYAYQAFVNLVFDPLLRMHWRLQARRFSLWLREVGNRQNNAGKRVNRRLRAAAMRPIKVLSRNLPQSPETKPEWSAEFAADGGEDEQCLVQMANLVSWAFGEQYNEGREKWSQVLDQGLTAGRTGALLGYGQSARPPAMLPETPTDAV